MMNKLLPGCKTLVLAKIFFVGLLLLPGFNNLGWGQTHIQTTTKFQNSTARPIACSFAAASTTGNLIVVHLDWGGQTISINTVTDNKGNTYTRINGPTNWDGVNYRAELWYAYNITGGGAAITVTATLSGAPTGFSQIYISEYSGIVTTNPLDQNSVAIGNAAAVSSGFKTTTMANELIYGASIGASGALATGAGFTNRSAANGNIIEEKNVFITGSYNAAFTCAGGNWVAQMATFIASTISTGTISGSPFCKGANVSVPFTINGTYIAGNVFTAQLSDASGSFAAPIALGTLTSTAAGTIAGIIPIGTTAGTLYRIRVVSSTPGRTGTNNGSNLTVNPSPAIGLTVGGTGSICSGTGTNITVASSVSGTNYQLRNNVGNGIVGSSVAGTGVTINLPTGNLSSTTTFNVLATIASTSCSAQLTGTATVTVNPNLPVSVSIAASPSGAICSGTSVTFTASPTNGGTTPSYQWKLNGSNVGTNSTTYTNAALANGNTVTCVLTSNASPCATGSPATSNTVTITVNPLPVAAGTITGTATVCQGQAAVAYSVPAITNATSYTWAYSGTGATVSGPTASMTITFAANSTAGNLTVRGTNACGNGTASANYAIAVNPLPTVNVGGAVTAICQGGTTAALGGSYGGGATAAIWSATSGTFANNTGSTPGTATFTAAANSTTPITLTLTTSGGSCGITSANKQVTVNPLPIAAGTITGTTTVCQGQATVAYSVPAITNATSYTWAYSGTGATITGSTNSVTITFAVNATSGNLTVRGTNACGNGTVSGNYAITVNPLPVAAGTITGTATVCPGQATVAYSVPAITNATSYTWAYSGTGATITGSTNSVTITFAVNATSGNLTVQGTNACGNGTASANYAITVNQLPTITGQPASPAAVCSGTNSSTFTVAATGTGLNYQWQRGISGTYVNITGGTTPNDGCTYSGYTGATLTITDALSGMNGYTYRCVVSGTCTPSATSNGSATLTVSTAPVITGQPASPGAVCAGTARTFTITATGTGLTYQWQRGIAGTYTNITAATTPNDGCTYSGFTGVTLTITNPTVGMNGYTYRCVVSSGSCNSTSDGNATLSINAAPAITGQPASPPTVIAGTNSSTFTVTATGTGLTYQWQRGITGTYTSITAAKTPNDGVVSTSYSGFLTATLTVANAPLGMNGYTYRCVVSGTCTPSVTSNGAATLNVTSSSCITTQPSSVTICTGVNTSFAVVATGSPAYQWQVSTNGGGTYTDITAAGTDPVYSNYTTATLGIAPTNPAMNGYKYRCRLTGGCAQISSAATLTLRIINISYKLSASPDLVETTGSINRNSTLTLSGSQTGVNYQLRTGTTPIGSAVAGTGGSISFALVTPTVSTQYNVLATTATGGCSAQITDTKGVTVNETGIIISLTTCNGQPGLNFFTNSNFGTTATNNYQTPDQGLFPGVILGNPLGAYTNYTYGLVSNAIPDGNYVIANSTAGMYRTPQQVMTRDVWLLTGDRSGSPDGHMYIVNASNTPGEFYTETLSNLCENTRYEFRADVINLYAANWVPNGPDYLSYFPVDGQGNRYSILPNVDFMIDGRVALNTGDIMNDGSWKTFGFTFRTAPNQTSISFTMRNNSTGGIGNDLALDNIIMRVCGPVIDIKVKTTLPVCAGQPVTMSAKLIAVDYQDPKYQWQISTNSGDTWNDISGATDTTYTNSTPVAGEFYRYKVAETVASLSRPNCSVASDAVSIPATAGILSTTPGSRCQAGTVTLGATASSGATINWYDASSGGNLAGTGTSFTTPSISTTTTYYVEAINSACPAVRMPVVATINPIVTADVTISASTGNSICSGTSVTFTATPTNGGATPSYQWKLNGANVGTDSPTYTTTALANGNTVSCVMTSSIVGCIAGSPATSNTITMTVGTSVVASVSISANPGNTICQGSSVTFTAVPVNGGSTPTYQWKKNTVDISSELANTYTTSSLVQGDIITCVMTTSLGCATGSPATSNGITMTVYNTLTAGISGGSSPICYNTAPGTFTATGGGGTGSYTYLWYKDGLTTGVTTQTYAPGNLTATSTFYCAITSGSCGTVNTSTTTITVTALPTATISYSGTPFCTTIITAQPITLNGTGAYTGGTYGSTAGLTLDVGTGAVIPSTSTPGTYTVTYTIPASGGCGIVTTTTLVTINLDGSWNGSLSTDWNTPGNWACNQLPTLTTDVIIANGKPNYPTLSTGSPGMSRNLTIGSNSSVTVTGNILQIAGSITNSGTLFTATAGTVEMKGSGAQTIGADVFAGNTIMNLTINNSAGVTLQGSLSVTGIVSTTAGNLSSGGYLTLVSTVSQTALIDGTGTGIVSGNVTMQRYLSSAFGYKYFSSPFSNAIVGAFSSFMDLGATFPTFYRYDENHLSPTLTDMAGWTTYTAIGGALNRMEGYAVNFGPTSSEKTINITGAVNNGPIQINLMNHNRTYTKGFNLVGNPYPSPIDWGAAAGWTKTNIDGAIYFFNASDQYTGMYSSYVNDVGVGKIIPSMQGFFVHVTNGTYPVTATLGMNNGVRMNGLSSGFHKSGYSSDTRPIIRFTAGYADEKNPADPVVIYFDEKATVEFDSKLDALKLMNTDVKVPNFYALSSDTSRLSINAIPYPDSMSVVPLGLKTEQAGRISFSTTGIENMPSGLQIYFFDNKTGIYTDLLQSTGFKLNMIAGTDEKRFSLIFSKRVLSDTQGSNDAFVVYSSGGKLIVSFTGTEGEKGDMVINNMIGQELWRQQIIGTGIHEFDPQLKTGVYIVSFYSGKDIYSKKVLITNQ